MRARALLVEGSDLSLTIANTGTNLSAEVTVLHGVKDNLDEVAGLALVPQLAACSIDEGKGTAVLVWGIVAAGHDNNDIGAGSIGLGVGPRDDSLSDSGGSDCAERESVADDGRHY